MINNTTLVGRLTKDPELRYTGTGIAVLSFTLAVERNYTNSQGQRETDFIQCQSWRGTAEIISNLAVKGSLVGVTGNIQTRNYKDNQNRTIYITEVVVDDFQMLEPKAVTDNRRNQNTGVGHPQNNYSNNQTPNTTTGYQSTSNGAMNNQGIQNNNADEPVDNPFKDEALLNQDPFELSDDVKDISDDDLPF